MLPKVGLLLSKTSRIRSRASPGCGPQCCMHLRLHMQCYVSHLVPRVTSRAIAKQFLHQCQACSAEATASCQPDTFGSMVESPSLDMTSLTAPPSCSALQLSPPQECSAGAPGRSHWGCTPDQGAAQCLAVHTLPRSASEGLECSVGTRRCHAAGPHSARCSRVGRPRS